MDPCPNCEHTVSLQELDAEIEQLRRREATAAGDRRGISPRVLSSSSVTGFDILGDRSASARGGGLVATCAKCGLNWSPDARHQAKEKVEKIRELKMKLGGPVEAIGDLTRKELPKP